MRRNKRGFWLYVFFLLSLFFPVGWTFWLGWQRLNYYSFTFSLADAWLAVCLLCFLVTQKTKLYLKLFLILFGLVLFMFYRHQPLFWWVRFYYLFRLVVLSIIGGCLLHRVPKDGLNDVLSVLLVGFIGSTFFSFVWLNFFSFSSPFRVFLLGRYWYFPTLFFPHPNILAFAVLSLFFGLLLLDADRSIWWWLGTALVVLLTGSLTGGVILLFVGFALLRWGAIWFLLMIYLLSLLTDWSEAELHFSWLYPHSMSLLSFWPTTDLALSLPNSNVWATQPIHSTFFLVGLGIGWLWLILGVLALLYLFFKAKRVGSWLLLAFFLWLLIDHFFITSWLGQNLTAFFISLIISYG